MQHFDALTPMESVLGVAKAGGYRARFKFLRAAIASEYFNDASAWLDDPACREGG
ncbi:hypothetical protein [Pelagibacterium luteolum]|uniref:hypothetical protein n=1 Tax=Pelagibacterium luteolum TaxID=440168 RepID=UPI0015A06533|nr:hypothetical protein [Pelagibacterium luteolum]